MASEVEQEALRLCEEYWQKDVPEIKAQSPLWWLPVVKLAYGVGFLAGMIAAMRRELTLRKE